MGLFDVIRSRAAEVSRQARFVEIDFERAGTLARDIAREGSEPTGLDPGAEPLGDFDTTLAYVVTLDAINFGSGWFPYLAKRPGHSGYRTVAGRLRDQFRLRGAWTASELGQLKVADCAEILGQSEVLDRPEVAELMDLYARALRDLGAWLGDRFGGSFHDAVAAADGSAERLVIGLAEMPFYRDVSEYGGEKIAFYKRAQITAADLQRACRGAKPGHFEDLDELTLFADNLVPHVLRQAGVLIYDPLLLQRIERRELLVAGSREEIEIRAAALHAVESMAEKIAEEGIHLPARELDTRLWNRGQRPESKAQPRHRARCVYY